MKDKKRKTVREFNKYIKERRKEEGARSTGVNSRKKQGKKM